MLECQSYDQGVVLPLLTACGVAFMCDEGGEVWLAPEDVGVVEPIIPRAPDWTVVPGLSVAPGTTSWAIDAG